MQKLIFIMIACLISQSSGYAEALELRDPTRPPGFVFGESAMIVTWQLDAIILSKDRKVAVINGQPVMLGEKIAGNQLISIDSNSVQLRGTDGRMTLFLLDSNLKIESSGD